MIVRLHVVRLVIACVALACVFAGWRTMWFLTDDAYIEFRYVANAVAGDGFVWNPPPFRPVEGYTSFLWVFLLKVVWQLTGFDPTESANPLSLVFGCGTIALTYAFVARMDLPEPARRHRLGLVALVLLGTVTNRTFLTWLSSGLETALFNFCFTWWIFEALTPPGVRTERWVARLSTAAALTALTRPDGLLVVSGSIVIVAIEAIRGRIPRKKLAMLAPLALVVLHVLWRRLTYGDWLPNTYYAKHVRPWPESGLKYLASFVLEYGVCVWLLIALAWLVAALRSMRTKRRSVLDHGHSIIASLVVIGHVAYYTLIIGGDHFEYRVYSYLVPLLFVSGAWCAAHLFRRPVFAFAAVGMFVLASLPIGWVHWEQTHELRTRRETHILKRPIAEVFPAPLRPIVREWDALQAWLIVHHVGMRHQEHKVFHEWLLETLPSREDGSQISWRDRPVLAWDTVGVMGWVLPNVAIIDRFGLNDRVIARSPPRSTSNENRLMAHDRSAPPGYLNCFRPNVRFRGGRAVVIPRERPLGDDEIHACESRDW
jgi:arabinofuranosyltransferase